jgi:hypothetical protein
MPAWTDAVKDSIVKDPISLTAIITGSVGLFIVVVAFITGKISDIRAKGAAAKAAAPAPTPGTPPTPAGKGVFARFIDAFKTSGVLWGGLFVGLSLLTLGGWLLKKYLDYQKTQKALSNLPVETEIATAGNAAATETSLIGSLRVSTEIKDADYLNASPNKNQNTFVNYKPLTILQAGYMKAWPGFTNQFEPAKAISQAIANGFRSFIFQIDYIEQPVQGFGFINTPMLMVRGPDGSRVSTNKGDIEKVCMEIANRAFCSSCSASSQPVVIYLHFNRVPFTFTEQPKAYLDYLSKVAKALKPLAPYHLGMTSDGTFNRSKNEGLLLNTRLENLAGKVVILTNANTEPFQNVASLGIQKYAPSEDLNFWTNLRVYKLVDSDSGVGTVTEAKTQGAYAYIHSKGTQVPTLSSSTFMPEKFKIILPDVAGFQDAEISMIAAGGYNVIPMDLFGYDSTEKLVTAIRKQQQIMKAAGGVDMETTEIYPFAPRVPMTQKSYS